MRWVPLVAAGLLATACAGSDAVEPAATQVESTVATGGADTTVSIDDIVTTTTVAPDVVPNGAVTVALDSESVTLAGELATSIDPFAEFVSCSGLRASFTTYSVLVSTTDGDVRSVSAVTTGVVVAEGIHDAVVRVEFGDGSSIDAVGTMTLLPGYQTGSFIAFDTDGTPVEGSFTCEGSITAAPVAVGADDGVLEQIDVFALLRRGDSSRLVGLAVAGDSSASVECPGAAGIQSDLVVAVMGDDSSGAITSFDLFGGDTPRLAMQVGDERYEFDDVVLGEANTDVAGSFSAEVDGIAVDGAFRCS